MEFIKKNKQACLFFNFMIIFLFIDFNIGPLPIKMIILFLIFLYFITSSNIFFKSATLFLTLFLIYAIYSSINLYGQTQHLSLTHGYMRPMLVFITVMIQVYLSLYFFRLKVWFVIPWLLVSFLSLEILLLIFGLLDNSYLKNEKGLHANLIVFLIYIFLRQRNLLRVILIPIVSLASTLSSSILALMPIVFLKNRVVYLIAFLFVLLVFLVFDELVASKISLLLSPPDVGTYGGRYWSNFIYIEQIKSNIYFGSGIESLFLYKQEHYFVEMFDHGGADILRLISEFGIFGAGLLFIFYRRIHKKIRSYGYRIDYTGLVIVTILSIKGIQIFSNPGMLMLVFLVMYKKIHTYNFMPSCTQSVKIYKTTYKHTERE
jgi:hypothetical protein